MNRAEVFYWWVVGLLLVTLILVAVLPSPKHQSTPPITRTLDTLPTGTIVVCYTPTHGDGVACVLDPAMQGATP